jgi:hypothetical protein
MVIRVSAAELALSGYPVSTLLGLRLSSPPKLTNAWPQLVSVHARVSDSVPRGQLHHHRGALDNGAISPRSAKSFNFEKKSFNIGTSFTIVALRMRGRVLLAEGRVKTRGLKAQPIGTTWKSAIRIMFPIPI